MTPAQEAKRLICLGRTKDSHRQSAAAVSVVAALCLVGPLCAGDGTSAHDGRARKSRTATARYVAFEPNQGQFSSDVQFAGELEAIRVAFTLGSVVLTVPAGSPQGTPAAEPPDPATPERLVRERRHAREAPSFTNITMRFIGSNPAPRMTGLDPLPGKGYYIAADGTPGRGPVSQYGRVEYHDIYPDIDLAFYVSGGRLEYDVLVRPGGDPSVVDFEFEGMDDLALSSEGDLVLQTPGGRLRHRQPRSFAKTDAGEDQIPTRFRLNGRRLGFDVTAHDRRKALRIDPVIEWEGTPGDDYGPWGFAIAVDAAGNSYTAGLSWPPLYSPSTLVVSKFDGAGHLVYHTAIDVPSPYDFWCDVAGIAVDAAGAAHVAGSLNCGFPSGGLTSYTSSGFLAKLAPDGSSLAFPLLQIKSPTSPYSPCLAVNGLALDATGNSYVVGEACGVDVSVQGASWTGWFNQSFLFPLARPLNLPHTSNYEPKDAFLAVIGPQGQTVMQGLFGGDRADRATDVTVDRSGAVYVVGYTESPNFPTTEGAFQRQLAQTSPNVGFGDCFLLKLQPMATALVYSTLIGGVDHDLPLRVAVDRWGSAHVAGETLSSDFPGTGNMPGGSSIQQAAFLVKVNRQGSALRYSRLYGPEGAAYNKAIAVAVGGDGTSYWAVRATRFSGGSECSTSYRLTTLSRSGDIQDEQILFSVSGDGDSNVCIGSGTAYFPLSYERPGGLAVDQLGNVLFGLAPTGRGTTGTLTMFDTGRVLMRPDARCHGECVAANPAHRVNVVTGNAWLDQADGEGLDAGGLLPFTRSYNSQAAVEGMPGPLGPGWSHAYSRHLEFVAGGIRLVEDDGVPALYGSNQLAARFVPTTPVTGRSWIDRSGVGYTRFFPGGDSEEYDVFGRLSEVIEGSGQKVTLERDPDTGQISRLRTSSGSSLELTYQDTPNELRLTGVALGGTILATYEYDEHGYLSSVTRPGPEILRFRYDDDGQLLSATDGSRSVIAAFTYGGNYQAVRSDIAGGQERFAFTYGGAGTSVTDAQGWTTSYDWTEIQGMRAITRRTAPCETCEGGGSFVDAWTYTPEGRVASHDANGLLTSLAYNTHGDVETVTDPEMRATSYTYAYGGDGQVLRQTRLSPGGGTVERAFGPSGLLKGVTEALSEDNVRSVAYAYDRGRLRSVTDPAGQVWQVARDGSGKVAAVTTPMHERTSYAYDSLGRVTSTTNNLGQITESLYDPAGRLAGLKRADDATIEFKYDSAGRLSKAIDPLGRTTGRSYDSTGRLVGIRDAANGATQFAYDSMSRLKRLTDAEGRTSSFDYFGDGSVKRMTSPGGAQEAYSYSPRGWLVQRADRRGVTTNYSHDTVGRLTGKTYSDGTPAVSFTYDVEGRLQTASNGADSLRWTYDLAGQPLTETSTRRSTTVGYTHGLRGERLSLRLNGTLLGGYFYDDDGRMTRLSTTVGQFGLEYDALSRRKKLVHPNGVVTEYGYDDLSRLTSVVAHQPAATVASHAYTYDAVDNRTSKTSPDVTETYGYDAVDRLKSVARAGEGGIRALSYDRVGNRLAAQADGDVRGASYNARNQLTSITGGGILLFRGTLDEPGVAAVNGRPARMVTDRVFEADVAVVAGTNTVTVEAWDVSGNRKTERFSVTLPSSSATFQYDANGNLTEKTEGGHVLGFEWNAENELERVTRDGAEVARFQYDPLGRRVKKTAGGITYDYVYDGLDILKETHSNGNAYTYVHGPGIDEPLARFDQTNAVAYYHADGLGSIVRTTNANGDAVETKKYDAWGNLEAGASQPGYAFTGREWDPETGLYYYRARYYDPRGGRFISADPIGFAGGDVNLYGYVRNNPVNLTDPLGLDPFRPVWDMWRNYWDMRKANWQRSDRYFHCKGSCEASRRGFAAAFTAGMMGEGREMFDQHAKRDPESACDADRVANDTGREGDRNLPCEVVCGGFRPPGLPPQY